MDKEQVLSEIRKDFDKAVDLGYKEGSYRYFKEQIRPLGVRLPEVRRITVKYYSLLKKEWKFEDFVSLSEGLLRDGWFEETAMAFGILENFSDQFDEESFRLFESWLKKYISNWAHCDEMSNHLIGSCVENRPKLLKNLLSWTCSKNRWVRRSSAVSLVLPARRGLFLAEIFEISEKLMADDDDLVQKGVGWLLKEASKKHEVEVVRFLLKWRGKTSRVVLRYATEKMSARNRKFVLV